MSGVNISFRSMKGNNLNLCGSSGREHFTYLFVQIRVFWGLSLRFRKLSIVSIKNSFPKGLPVRSCFLNKSISGDRKSVV